MSDWTTQYEEQGYHFPARIMSGDAAFTPKSDRQRHQAAA